MVIRLLTTAMALIMAAILFYLGVEYIYVGRGLHPLLAFPGGILGIICPIILLFGELSLAQAKEESDWAGHEYLFSIIHKQQDQIRQYQARLLERLNVCK